MALANKDALVDALPAHREEEITGKVLKNMPKKSLKRPKTVFSAQKAVMVKADGLIFMHHVLF